MSASSLANPAAIDCLADVPCNRSPAVVLDVDLPSVAPDRRNVRIPNAGGGDSFTYGGYLIELTGLQPAYNPEASIPWESYKLVLRVTRQ